MQLLATEQLGTGVSRDIGVAPGAGGTDHCFNIPVPALGMDTQCTAQALDGGDPYWALNRELIGKRAVVTPFLRGIRLCGDYATVAGHDAAQAL